MHLTRQALFKKAFRQLRQASAQRQDGGKKSKDYGSSAIQRIKSKKLVTDRRFHRIGGQELKVLLREKVDKLGNPGDIINVAPGYARNYLLPGNIAVKVTEENMRRIEREQEKRRQEMEKMKLELTQVKEKLEQTSVTVIAQATEEGRLYGSVTQAMISEAFAKKGLDIADKAIIIDDSIKELGIYEIKIELGPELEALTKLWVVEEE